MSAASDGATAGSAGRLSSAPVLGVLGEVLVEVMRPAADQPLDQRGAFEGPFASGAPAIFAAAAAALGGTVRLAGVVGDDPFGRLCLRRLREHGVEEAGLRVAPDRTTGVAFVAYRSNGEREFVFHLSRAAAAELEPVDVEAMGTDGLTWLHVSGSSLGVSPTMRAACEAAARRVAEAGGTVGFDPNLRAELSDPAEARDLCAGLLRHARVVLPSGHEAMLLTGARDVGDGCRRLVADGAELVVLKRGADGCTLFGPAGPETGIEVPGFATQVRDPTGAGDVFAAGLAVALVEGAEPADAAAFANAAASATIGTLGPMEGLADRATCERIRARV
ncbi:MAG: sugar kinase [Deinococcus-Thermus bacterium]|jgi:sugar/nucleoside kinase (ribokinase family)|nr:sugar kinase [Deinococcota bacterium]